MLELLTCIHIKNDTKRPCHQAWFCVNYTAEATFCLTLKLQSVTCAVRDIREAS